MAEKSNEQVAAAFKKALNSGGFGFQYAALWAARLQRLEEYSDWILSVSEFPVSVQGGGTRIDFVLEWMDAPPKQYLICECKRVDPAYHWCFAKAPFVRPRALPEKLIIEHAFKTGGDPFMSRGESERTVEQLAYHIGVVVKSGKKGGAAEKHNVREGIEKTASQVCRQVNGFIEYFARAKQHSAIDWEAYFVPVIFTTARLFVSSVQLNTADLKDGTVSNVDAKEVDSLVYQYHLSPGIKHGMSYIHECNPEDLGGVLATEFIRSIYVVSAKGIESFLKQLRIYPEDIKPIKIR